MVEIGAVQGRFQGLHLGHMEFLLEAKKRCQFLIIGITNYDIHSQYISDDAKLNRFRSASNPFTFFERMMMITASMVEAGIPRDQFTVVPFPIVRRSASLTLFRTRSPFSRPSMTNGDDRRWNPFRRWAIA